MNYKITDYFGEFLIKRIRKLALIYSQKLISGKMYSTEHAELRYFINGLTKENISELECLIQYIIDNVLHTALVSIEEQEQIDIVIIDSKGKVHSLKENSDGLGVDFHVWKERFSQNI